MYVVSVYRTEADADPNRPHHEDPFDGHEILFVSKHEDDMNESLDRYHRLYPTWQFHIEEV